MGRDVIKINYLGLKCGVCSKDFAEDDDVVVCPDCGTPMHRLCYKENKGCPNSEKHGENFVFEGFDKIKESAQGVKKSDSDTEKKKDDADLSDGLRSNDGAAFSSKQITCPFCGELNKAEANFCNRCGSQFVKIQPIPVMNENGSVQGNPTAANPFEFPAVQAAAYAPDPLSGVPANAEFEENVTAADLACYVSVNTPYYMRAFDLMKKKAKKFNFSALVFSGVWFLYRKLYKIGAFIFALETLLYAVRFYFSQTYSMDVMKKLFAEVGLSVDKITSLNMEQYAQLSSAMQKLPVAEQLVMMIPSFIFLLQIIVMIVCGIIGNRIYYDNCVKNIQSIKKQAEEESLDRTQTAQAIYLKGGVNPFLAGVLCLFYLYIIFL